MLIFTVVGNMTIPYYLFTINFMFILSALEATESNQELTIHYFHPITGEDLLLTHEQFKNLLQQSLENGEKLHHKTVAFLAALGWEIDYKFLEAPKPPLSEHVEG